MIVGSQQQAVYHYAYRPLQKTQGVTSHDGGFSITLYSDNTLLITYYDDRGRTRSQTTYSVPPSVVGSMRRLIDSCDRWFGSVPSTMHLEGSEYPPRFVSRIGLEGYRLIEVEDVAWMTTGPFLDPAARTARKLVALLEDACEVLLPSGIILGLDGFDVDAKSVRNRQNNDGRAPWIGAAGF